MRHVDEYRDPGLVASVAREIARTVDPARTYRIMEVCGGHTHAIYRYGLGDLLPKNLELIHGPGCPVCVLPVGRIDDALWLTERPGVVLTCFGDVMRVPGADGTLLARKAQGADVRIVYSPLDAARLAEDHPEKHVAFFAIGFETTAPSTALTLIRAKERALGNFSVFCNHVTIGPAMQAVLESDDVRIDAFVAPGHVSTVIGCLPYEFVARQYRRPVVVAGFEPLDVLEAILMIVRQLEAGEVRVENQYRRSVRPGGNPAALRAMDETFELRSSFEWRGLGAIPVSGLKIRAAYAPWDAERRFALPGRAAAEPEGARCGDVLKGAIKPPQCALFGKECRPESPVGALMVSSEGACAARYRYAAHGAATQA